MRWSFGHLRLNETGAVLPRLAEQRHREDALDSVRRIADLDEVPKPLKEAAFGTARRRIAERRGPLTQESACNLVLPL